MSKASQLVAPIGAACHPDEASRRLMGEPGRPLHYVNLGRMATLGRGEAVSGFPRGLALRAAPAWIAWLGVHLSELSGIRNLLAG